MARIVASNSLYSRRSTPNVHEYHRWHHPAKCEGPEKAFRGCVAKNRLLNEGDTAAYVNHYCRQFGSSVSFAGRIDITGQ